MTAPAAAYRWDVYRGGGWFICDVCGQRWRRSRMLTRWDGLKVDAKCDDPRPPQMEPPTIDPGEGRPFLDARPPQDNPDRLNDDSYLMSQPGGITVTDGSYPIYPNGQKVPIGAYSPQPITVDPIPADTPPADLIEDDVTLRTGPVFPPSVPYITGTGTSPGPVPFTGPPVPPFLGED
jgi:hypothetical protein